MLDVQSLMKEFPGTALGAVTAVNGINFTVQQGQFFTLVGPSGCGKSTTLRCIAGLEEPTAGVIAIDGRTVFNSQNRDVVPSHQRDLGMVFQSYAVWPHMSVFDNVAYPLRHSPTSSLSRVQIRERVGRVLEVVRMSGYEQRSATQLSGGQQQRVALARALVGEPSLLLLDEPLSNLDAKLRQEMRVELKRLQNELGITTVLVTHDQSEALVLSDEVAVMNAGEIIQSGGTREVYNRPKTRFVATFIGDTNFLEGVARARSEEGTWEVQTSLGPIWGVSREPLSSGDRVGVSIRPEDITVCDEQSGRGDAVNSLDGRIELSLFMGRMTEYSIQVNGYSFKAEDHDGASFDSGDTVRLEFNAESCVLVSDDSDYEADTPTEPPTPLGASSVVG